MKRPYDDTCKANMAAQNCFKGRARVHLKHLRFETELTCGSRTLDQKNVARLIGVFEKQGCQRLNRHNAIAAVIDADTLVTALTGSGVAASALMNDNPPPLLKFHGNFQINCLHGQHRIEAAKTHLMPGDLWWVVDIYLDGQIDINVQEEIGL